MVLPGGGELTFLLDRSYRTMWKVKFLLGWPHPSPTGVRSQAEGRFTLPITLRQRLHSKFVLENVMQFVMLQGQLSSYHCILNDYPVNSKTILWGSSQIAPLEINSP